MQHVYAFTSVCMVYMHQCIHVTCQPFHQSDVLSTQKQAIYLPAEIFRNLERNLIVAFSSEVNIFRQTQRKKSLGQATATLHMQVNVLGSPVGFPCHRLTGPLAVKNSSCFSLTEHRNMEISDILNQEALMNYLNMQFWLPSVHLLIRIETDK